MVERNERAANSHHYLLQPVYTAPTRLNSSVELSRVGRCELAIIHVNRAPIAAETASDTTPSRPTAESKV